MDFNNLLPKRKNNLVNSFIPDKADRVVDGFYHFDQIFKVEAEYYMVFGERASGKSYAALKYALSDYLNNGNLFVYMRRQDIDLQKGRSKKIFRDLINNGEIEQMTGGEYDRVIIKNNDFYLAKYDEDQLKTITAPEPFGTMVTLSTEQHEKSVPKPNTGTIIFDEFLARPEDFYLVNEVTIFFNSISTVVRQNKKAKIIMLGNTVNMFCPYFAEMGLTHVTQMELGQIDTYLFTKVGADGKEHRTRVAVEYTDGYQLGKKRDSDDYFCFDNPKLRMITDGSWEFNLYPHLPNEHRNYRPKDILFTYYIIFDTYLMRADIIYANNTSFTYIHRQTRQLRNQKESLFFQREQVVSPNFRVNITKPEDELGDTIYGYFYDDKVYFEDNEVGNAVDNYIKWCKQNRGRF